MRNGKNVREEQDADLDFFVSGSRKHTAVGREVPTLCVQKRVIDNPSILRACRAPCPYDASAIFR